jgi:hypothetical protein
MNSRQGLAEASFQSQLSTESGTTDVLDLLADEKAAAMNPEKSAYMQRTLDNNGVLREISLPVDALESQQTTLRPLEKCAPGAFRMGFDQASMNELTVCGGSVVSDGSESCVFVVPQALLVKEEEGRDIEAPSTEIPVVAAKEMVESVDSVAAQPRSELRSSRCFRLSVIGCLLLIVVLLATFLGVFFSGRNSPKNDPTTFPPILGSSTFPPKPPPTSGGGNGGNGGGGNGGNGGGGNGGDGGGGNGGRGRF